MRRLTAVLAAATVAIAACSDTGPVREPAELVDIESPKLKPRVLWDRTHGAGTAELHVGLRLAVEADAVFSADVDGDVFALEPKAGRRLWRAETGARLAAGPSVLGDLVLVGTRDAEVIALKRSDGSELWRTKVSSEVLAPPAGAGATVVVRCGDGKVFGLAADNGTRKWSFDRAVPPLTLRGLSAPVIVGNTVYLGLDNGRAIALALESGELQWEQVVTAPSGRTELERIVDVDADVFVSDDGLYAVSFGGELAAVGLDEGRVAWRRPIKSYSGIALIDRRLIVTDDTGTVWALDAETGASIWTQEALKYRRVSGPAVHRGYIAVADLEGIVHWLAPEDGRIVARVDAVGDPVVATPIVRDEILYVLDTSGEVAAVDAQAIN